MSSCSDTGFFDSDELIYTLPPIVYRALGVFFSVVLAGVYLVIALTRKQTSKIAPFWLYGPAILFAIVSYIGLLVATVLRDCGILNDSFSSIYGFFTPKTYADLFVVYDVLWNGLAWLIFLGIFMIPLTLGILNKAHFNTGIIKLVQIGLFVLVCILWVAQVAVTDSLYLKQTGIDYYRKDYKGLVDASKGLQGTFYLISLLVVVETIALLVMGFTRLSGQAISSGTKIYVPLTCFFFFGSELVFTIEAYRYYVTDHYYTPGAYIAIGLLEVLLPFGAAYSLLFAAAGRTWGAPRENVAAAGNNWIPPHRYNGVEYQPPTAYAPNHGVQSGMNPYPPQPYQEPVSPSSDTHGSYHAAYKYGPHELAQNQRPTEMAVPQPELAGLPRYEVGPGQARSPSPRVVSPNQQHISSTSAQGWSNTAS